MTGVTVPATEDPGPRDRGRVREELGFAYIAAKRPLRVALIAVFDRIVTNLRYPVRIIDTLVSKC